VAQQPKALPIRHEHGKIARILMKSENRVEGQTNDNVEFKPHG
jgi:hypothetical protein